MSPGGPAAHSHPGTIVIPLTRGRVAIIDEVDHYLTAFRWYVHGRGQRLYAARSVTVSPGKEVTQLLHRAVLLVPPGVQVDHVNGDGLDCRRANLRPASPLENARNCRLRATNQSGFKGVHFDIQRRRWRAQIRWNLKRRHLGYYDAAEEAARAYDAAALEHFGAFARVNFPAEGRIAMPGGVLAHNHPEESERVQTHYNPATRDPAQMAQRARGVILGHRDALCELAGLLSDHKLPGGSALLSALSALGEAAAALRGDGR